MNTMLKSLGCLATGNTPSKKVIRYWNSNDIPFIKPADLKENSIEMLSCGSDFISHEAEGYARIAKKDTVLVTCKGIIGKVGIVTNENVAFNQQLTSITPNQSLVYPRYLAWNLVANKKRLQSMSNAPVVPIINKTQLSEFEIKVEQDLNTQRKISQVLDCIEHQLNLHFHKLEILDNLVKSRFVEMFGDPNTCTTANTIEDAFYIRDDLRKPLSGKERAALRDGQLYPYYGANGQVDSINAYLTDCDALCFSEDCGSYGSDENTAYIIRGKAWVNNHAHLLIPKYQNFLEYARIFYLLLDVNRYISGTTRAKLTQAQLKRICIHIPSEKQLAEFADFVSQVDKLRFAAQKQIEKLETLKKSLMQEYFG